MKSSFGIVFGPPQAASSGRREPSDPK